MLIAVDMAGNVELWETGNLESPKLRRENTGIRMAVFSRDHKMLVTASQDGNLRLLDTESLKERKILASSIKTVASSPDGNTMITVSQSGQVKLWDTERLEEQKTMDLQLSDVGAVALSSDGKILAIGSGRIVKLSDAITGQGLATLTARGDWNASPIVTLTFSPDGKMLVAGNDKGVTLWYAATNSQMTALQGKH
jgi:WD40 repeat protein